MHWYRFLNTLQNGYLAELSADIGGTVIANDELQVLFTPAQTF